MLSSLAKYHTQDCVAVEIFTHQIISCQNIHTHQIICRLNITLNFVCLLCVTVVRNLFLAIVGHFHLCCMACQTVHNHQMHHQTLTYSFFSNCAPHSNKFFCFALTKTSHRDGNSDGWRNGNGDGRRNDNTMATTVMDGAMATAMAMDSAMAMQRQWNAQWQCEGNDGDGRRDSNGDGRCSSNAMAITAMDGATAMAMDGATETQCQWNAQWQRNGNDGDSDGRHDGRLETTAADARILPMPNPWEG
jgi:hypothetical protein